MLPDSSIEGDVQSQQDIALMCKVQSGDLEAFRELVEAHQSRVANAIARMVGAGFDHSELAHEVFVRVWKSASRYQPSARFKTWLMTITRNLVLNEIRYRSRRPTVSLNPAENEDSGPDMGIQDLSAQSPATALQFAELQTAIDQALLALPENQRTAVILRRYEDLSYEEIATVLETSVSSVKSLLFRARAQLREALQEFLE